ALYLVKPRQWTGPCQNSRPTSTDVLSQARGPEGRLSPSLFRGSSSGPAGPDRRAWHTRKCPCSIPVQAVRLRSGESRTSKCHRLDDATGHRWPVKVGHARRCPVGRGLRGSRVGGSGQSGQSAGRLAGCGCPRRELSYRRENEHYGQAPERAAADIIVEDDCESIGGPAQMTYPKLGPDSKARTKSVVIPEWEELTISRLTLKNSGRTEKVHGRLNVGSTNYHPDKFA